MCRIVGDLSSAKLLGTNLTRANLSGANLSYATLFRANLSGANLSYAFLSGAYLSNNLYDADLSNANLSNANLYNTNITYAILINLKYDNSRGNEETDFTYAIIDDSKFIDYILQFTSKVPNKIENKRELKTKLEERISSVLNSDQRYIDNYLHQLYIDNLLKFSQLPDWFKRILIAINLLFI